MLVASSVISGWWFGCPGSRTPPSQGALALSATAPGVKEGETQEMCGLVSPPAFGAEIPVRGEKRSESYSQCINGRVVTCHFDGEIE